MTSLYKVEYANHINELNAEVGIERVPESERYKILFEAACVLQYGRNNSPFNFTFTMLAMEISRELACVENSMQLFNSLEIKHIQVWIDSFQEHFWLTLHRLIPCRILFCQLPLKEGCSRKLECNIDRLRNSTNRLHPTLETGCQKALNLAITAR